MARAIWTGVITFGMVSVPVGLYTAIENHTVHFHQLQRGTADRIRNRRVNERTGKEVKAEDIVKGFEVTEGEYVSKAGIATFVMRAKQYLTALHTGGDHLFLACGIPCAQTLRRCGQG